MAARAENGGDSAVHRRARMLWTPQVVKMLQAFERTGKIKNLRVAQRHIDGILHRLGRESEAHT